MKNQSLKNKVNSRKMGKVVLNIIIAVVLTACSFGDSKDGASWHMVNVNYGGLQGDANLIINDGIVTVIDGGYYEESRVAFLPYLKELEIEKVHHFFVSHPHQDHYEGMEALQIGGISIDNVYFNMPPVDARDCCYRREHFIKYLEAAKKRGSELHDIGTGFVLDYPNGSKMEVLYAHKELELDGKRLDINDFSLIMQWSINSSKVLFAGDLNKTLGEFLSNDERMESDILKVPHHGVRGIAPNSFFERVNARLGLIPGTKGLWESERSSQAKKWLIDNGIPHCVNGLNGNVIVYFQEGITLVPEHKNLHCQAGNI